MSCARSREANPAPPSRSAAREGTASEAIADLQQQLDKIEAELTGLKEVIKTSLKEMEKLVRQFQEEKEP